MFQRTRIVSLAVVAALPLLTACGAAKTAAPLPGGKSEKHADAPAKGVHGDEQVAKGGTTESKDGAQTDGTGVSGDGEEQGGELTPGTDGSRAGGVDAKHRALVLINEVDNGRGGLYYTSANRLVPQVVMGNLGNLYGEWVQLLGNEATAQKLVDEIGNYADMDGIEAVDVVIHLHGGPGILEMGGGDTVNTSDLAAAIKKRVGANGKKLRALYSIACYGGTHNDDFLAAGFKVSSGAKGLHSSGIVDVPSFLKQWAGGAPFGRAATEIDNSVATAGALLNVYKLYTTLTGTADPEEDNTVLVGGAGELTIDDAP